MKLLTLVFGIVILGLPTLGFTQTSWTLLKKNAGPESWTCPQTVFTSEEGDHFTLTKEDGAEIVNLDRLNKGIFCNRHQNGTSFGTLTCVSNLKKSTESEVVYENQTCGSDLPFVKSCKPKETDKKVIVKSDSLLFSLHIGWQDDPVFECIYGSQ